MRRSGIVSLALLAAAFGASSALAQMRVALPKTDDADKVVITGMVPIPDVGEGAPQFTAQDLASLQADVEKTQATSRSDAGRCGGAPTGIRFDPVGAPSIGNLLAQEFEASTNVLAAASRAETVTAAAELSRRDAADGKVDTKAVEAAELKRQEAVRNLQKAREALAEAQAMIGDYQDFVLRGRKESDITWGDLDGKALNRRKEHVGIGIGEPPVLDALKITGIKAHQFRDTKAKGKDFVRVSGEIRNTSNATVAIPGLSVALVDQAGWVLNSQALEAEHNKSVGAGKSAPFQIDLRPAPGAMKTAVVTFAAKSAAKPRIGIGFFCAMSRAMSDRTLRAPAAPPLNRGPR